MPDILRKSSHKLFKNLGRAFCSNLKKEREIFKAFLKSTQDGEKHEGEISFTTMKSSGNKKLLSKKAQWTEKAHQAKKSFEENEEHGLRTFFCFKKLNGCVKWKKQFKIWTFLFHQISFSNKFPKNLQFQIINFF